jgi:nicotinate-nucleotide--dimethylbenzimidazole phosphoribosyltransferase
VSGIERPPLPPGFDDSRARDRRADPAGWRFADAERAAVWRAIRERRDIRRFRPDPLPAALVDRLLEAAHAAPSVGLMQPWRFVVVRSPETRAAMQALAERERLAQAGRFDARALEFMQLKIEGIREAPVSVCVCCDREAGGREVLGRGTIRDTDLYSTACAIENLWLAARAEGVGVGWVSFYRPADVQRLLGLPADVIPMAWLCLGFPDERPVRPGLEAAGWDRRRRLAELVHHERWGGSPARRGQEPGAGPLQMAGEEAARPPAWWDELVAGVRPGDAAAALAVRDASDELVKPAGSLGMLEVALERWAQATGGAPPAAARTAVLVFAGDHAVAGRGASLFPSRVSGQVAGAAARGETAIGVLARELGAELVVADVGLAGPRPDGVVDARVADGAADIAAGPAMSGDVLEAAVRAGHRIAGGLAERADVLCLGEIGIGNTTAAAALLAALTGRSPEQVCGRGTGLDAQGLARKRELVGAALEVNRPPAGAPLECLRRVGGLELAALAGAIAAGAQARRLVLLDGFAVGVAALVAVRLAPSVRDALVAGHRSAEPAHAAVLEELGLEPLLDLRLRLGEASGAALALPLLGLAAALHRGMRRFEEAGVERAGRPA